MVPRAEQVFHRARAPRGSNAALFVGGQFPDTISLVVNVLPMPVKFISFFLPFETTGLPENQTFHLYVSGLYFGLYAGANRPLEVRAMCFSRPGNPVLSHELSDQLFKRYDEAIRG